MVYIMEAISAVVSGRNLTEEQALLAMEDVMTGAATQSQVGAFLTGLRMKGETIEEITAFARTMRDKSIKITPQINRKHFSGKLTDTCGTGGDKLKTFNVSTISALVISGAGVPVAKHGNRSVSSKCGSADLLERLGVNVNSSPADVQISIEKAGIGFLFAPTFHPAMKHVARARSEIGLRTVFNVLGPLTNPASAEAQLVGVYDESLVRTIAEVLKRFGLKSGIVSHGIDGLDEISLIGKSHIARLEQDGTIVEEVVSPSTFGLRARTYEDIAAPDNIGDYAALALRILSSHTGLSDREDAVLEMILANSSAALLVSGKVDNFLDGVECARDSIESGKALEKLIALIKYSSGDPDAIHSIPVAVR